MSDEEISVLFVDDEPRVLQGITRMMFGVADDWQIETATSGEEALRKLAAGDFAVIVSDMRMPGMDGATLLEIVARRHPATVRVVLSGQTEEAAMLRAVAVAHRFLAKPCSAEALYEVVRRTQRLVNRLGSPDLEAMISRLGSLPSPPEVYLELMEALRDDEVSLSRIAAVVGRDPALCARVLQIANSAFFSRSPTPVGAVRQALARVGTRVVRSLALATGVFETSHRGLVGAELSRLQRQALAAAEIALRVDDDGATREEAFTAALLHDVGVVALAASSPKHAAELHAPGGALLGRELELHGATHAEIGAHLLDLWGLPHAIVEAVALHHSPELIPRIHARVAAVSQVASALAAGAPPDPELVSAYQLERHVASLAPPG